MNHKLSTLSLLLSLAACSSTEKASSSNDKNPPEQLSCHAPKIRKGFEIFVASDSKSPGSKALEVQGKTFYLKGKAVINSSDIVSITELRNNPSPLGIQALVYNIQLNEVGTRNFALATEKAKGEYMVVVRDGIGILAPYVAGTITGGQFQYTPGTDAQSGPVSELASFCEQ